MAESVISALVTDVLGRLTSAALQEFGLLRRLEDDLSTLRDTFNQIQAVLHDAEEKQMKQKAVETWLHSLRSVSLMVENVLNEASTEAMLQRLHNKRGIQYRVRAFFSRDYNQFMVRSRIAHKVKTTRKKLDTIASNRLELNLTPNAMSVVTGVSGEILKRETSSLIHDSIIYGRDEERYMVTEKICNKDLGGHDDNDVQIYVIWGMGGVGKTTLAQLIYNHERVIKHFELKYWMYVSSKFEIKEIIRGIIESIDKCECRLTQLDTMQLCLQEKLRKKRFLIVLDDVWIDENDRLEWQKLSKTLSCGAEGSVVMVTTRNQTTTQMMAMVPELQHKVGCLSEEDSWALFKKLAFVNRREEEIIRELEPIGREIVEKCKGLPLAVKSLAGLMLSKNSVSEWQLVKDNVIWELQESDILPALKLSYDNLRPNLKRCFSYCCLFPKGYKMSKDLLIELWRANDFIPHRGEVDLYVLGEEIFNSLVSRSFFQDVKEQENMDVICKIHDLMHDLARYVMRHDCLVIEPGKELLITPDELLHLSSSCLDFHISDQDSEKLGSLRSILIFANRYKGNIRQISNFFYVRVLYLGRIESRTLPPSISKLKHLRYLNISGSGIEFLPESIMYLQNLQVLLLQSCWRLRRLPKGMRYMKNLQRLDISYCHALEYMPAGIKELASLRRLSTFVVGKKNGARLGELGDLNLLGWELEFSGLENVGGLRDAQSANLKYKTNVLFLGLSWLDIYTRESKLETFARDEKVLEGLEPNSNLKQLSIENYIGKIISPSWMTILLNLVAIELSRCSNCEYIPPLGKLPNLRTISLYGMSSLKCFHDDDTTTLEDNSLFPSLQELYINACSDLQSLPSNLPKLDKLEIVICDRLVSLPSNLPKLKRLEFGFNYRLVSLPSNLPKLEVLHLQECKELLSLPSNLPNLKKLCIIGCEGLSLPNEMQSFRDLNELQIYGCEKLSRRCEKEMGVDWPKISHIPRIDIAGPRYLGSTE